MLSDTSIAPWIAAIAVFAVILIIFIQTPREVREYSAFSKSNNTEERISFFRKWLRESFLLYTLLSLAVLFVIGRLDTLSGFPPEFAALRRPRRVSCNRFPCSESRPVRLGCDGGP